MSQCSSGGFDSMHGRDSGMTGRPLIQKSRGKSTRPPRKWSRTTARRSSAYHSICITAIRLILVSGLVLLYKYHSYIDSHISSMYNVLLSSTIYNLAIFETLFVPFVYIIMQSIVYILEKHSDALEPFKIHPRTTWRSISLHDMIFYNLRYMTPLLLMDCVIVKRFHGANWKWDRWIYVWRALPPHAPSIITILTHLVLSFLIFDTIFFFLHLSWHKVPWLFKHVHREHHNHDEALHTQIVDQLSVAERVQLVLAANLSLNLLKAHPLTRTCFIVVFVFLLTENHCGLDLPVWYDKIVPFHSMGGARVHYEHHVKGTCHYAPFFAHWDWVYEWICGRGGVHNEEMVKKH